MRQQQQQQQQQQQHNVSTSEPQKVFRCRHFLYIFTSKCAFRRSGVQFLEKTERQKVVRGLQFFDIFTSKCAFRHSGVQFFDIRTSKSGPPTCFVHFHFQMCFSPQRRTIFRHQNVKNQKAVRTPHVLYIFTSKCAFRHSGVQFFDIRTSKSAPNPACFVHFHFQMCFSPQRRTIFRQANFKKCSEPVSFLTFLLQNVLFATAACNFWFLLWAATSAPAALTGLLLDWPDTRIIEKTQHFATSLTFGADVSSFFWLSRYCIFFLPTWLLVSSAFQLSILSEVCYLNFLRQIYIYIYKNI